VPKKWADDPTIGFVLGNGESRFPLDLDAIHTHGPVFGCNALYRDFTPTLLVSVDRLMVKEILDSGYQGHVIYRQRGDKRPHQLHSTHESTFYEDTGWSAGPTALYLMCLRYPNIKRIYLIGFDLADDGETDDPALLNNIYKDTENYRRSTDHATPDRQWVNQLAHVFHWFEGPTFIRVGPGRRPKEWDQEGVFYADFDVLPKGRL